jgi:hypothetical protein
MGSELGFLDCFLHDPICGSDLLEDSDSELGRNSDRFISDDFGNNKMDLLSASLHENGLLSNNNSQQNEVKTKHSYLKLFNYALSIKRVQYIDRDFS